MMAPSLYLFLSEVFIDEGQDAVFGTGNDVHRGRDEMHVIRCGNQTELVFGRRPAPLFPPLAMIVPQPFAVLGRHELEKINRGTGFQAAESA